MRKLIVAVVAAFVSAPAAAQVKQAAGVVAIDRSVVRDATALEAMVEAWSRGSTRFDFVDLAERARGKNVIAREKKGKEATASFEAGLEEYDSMSYESALAKLERAIELFEQADLTLHLSGLLDSYAARALTLFYAGRVSDARNQLIDLYTLRPDYVFDSSRLTPDIESHVDEARRSAQNAPPTTLEVHSNPVPGRVYVDGRYMGVTPVEVKSLTPGSHFVSVLTTGYSFEQAKHLAAPGQIAKFKLNQAENGRALLSHLEKLRSAFRLDQVPDVAAAMARWGDADEVVAVGVEATESGPLSITALRVAADGHLLAIERAEINMKGQNTRSNMDRMLDKLHAKDLPRGPNGEPIQNLDSSTSLFEGFPIGIVPAIGGVAAMGAGVALGLSAKATQQEAHGVPQLDVGVYQETMKKARGQALIADGLYVLGVAGLGFGAWLIMKGSGADSGGPLPVEDDVFATVVPLPGGGAVMIQGRF